MRKKYIVATRPSLLAYTQTQQLVALLQTKYVDCDFEIVKFSTHGDKVTDQPLTAFGGTGVFVKELENAMIEGRADFAVHSLKDVPGTQPNELVLAAFPKREDPRDVLLTKDNISFSALKDNCIIGTGSPRRIVQLMSKKKKATFADLRGNIDTRINKLNEGKYDAIVLAAAGLKRIGKTIPENAYLPIDVCLPAIGQAALVVECRKNDTETYEMLRSINHTETEIAIMAERSYMKTIGGGCKFPLAAYATVSNEKVHLEVMIGNHHTGEMILFSDNAMVEDAEKIGVSLGRKILEESKKRGISIP